MLAKLLKAGIRVKQSDSAEARGLRACKASAIVIRSTSIKSQGEVYLYDFHLGPSRTGSSNLSRALEIIKIQFSFPTFFEHEVPHKDTQVPQRAPQVLPRAPQGLPKDSQRYRPKAPNPQGSSKDLQGAPRTLLNPTPRIPKVPSNPRMAHPKRQRRWL